MANELKTVIRIETDGIEKFLNTTKQVEKELLQIEKTLKKQGFKGNEKELKASAKAYRNAMVKAAKDIEKRELQRVDRVKSATKSLNKVAARLTVGRSLADGIGRLISGLGDVIEKNKDTNESIGRLDKSFSQLKAGAASLAVGFLELVSGPIIWLIDGLESLVESVTGYNFAQARTIELLNEQNVAFNEEVDAILASNEAIDARTKSLNKLNETSNISSQLSIDASNEEIRLFRELTNLQNKFNTATTGRAVIGAQVAKASAKFNEAAKKSAADLLIITKEQLLVKKELNELSGGEERKLEGILDLEKERTDELKKQDEFRQKRLKELRTGAAGVGAVATEVQADIDKAVAEGRLKDAERLVKELENVRNAYDDVTASLKQSQETQVALDRQVIASQVQAEELANIYIDTREIIRKTVQDDIGAGISEFLTVEGVFGNLEDETRNKLETEYKDIINDGFIQIWQTVGLTPQQADKVFEEVNRSTKDFGELIDKLAAKGITSAFLDQMEADVITALDVRDDLKNESKKNQKLIEDQGIEAAVKRKTLDKQVLTNQTKIAAARIKIEQEVQDATSKVFIENAKLLTELGVGDIFDEFLAKEQEFIIANGILEKEIIDTQQKIEAAIGDEALLDRLNQLLIAQQAKLTSQIEIQQKELEALSEQFTDSQLAAFTKRFKAESKLLELSLKEQNLQIKEANIILNETILSAQDKRSEDGEKFSERELSIVRAQIQSLLKLEDDRFKAEKFLRVGAFLAELQDIEKRGGDVEVAQAKFQLKEAELYLKHRQNLQAIANKTPDEESKSPFLTTEQAVDLATQTAQAFADVFQAYTDFQDAVSQAAIDRISEQLSFINDELSETVGNIDSLESDLEGKRSGRRDAILRGLAIEAERERILTDKKIQLQKRLELEEKRQSERRKTAAIAQALINGAIAITNVWANSTIPYPAQAVFGGIQTAAIGAITGFQIAQIEAQTYEDGGMLQGPSHANGGIPFTVNGAPGFEAEGGEAIMSQRTVAMFGNQLNAMQKATGSKALFADGGMVPDFNSMSNALSSSQKRQIESLSSQPIYVQVTDISNQLGRQAEVTSVTNI